MKTFRQFKIFRSGSSLQRSLLSKLFPVLCVIIIFCSPFTVYAAETVTPQRVYVGGDIAVATSFGDTETTISSSGSPIVTHYDMASYRSSHWCGITLDKSKGYLTGVINVDLTITSSLPVNPPGTETSIELVNVDVKSPVTDGSLQIVRFYLSSGRVKVQLNFKDYWVKDPTVYFDFDYIFAVANTAGTLPPFLSVSASGSFAGYSLSYSLTKNVDKPSNLSDFTEEHDNFKQQIFSGQSSEDSLTSSALSNVNSFVMADPSSGSGMASALSFYSAVVTAGYISLGDFQNLFIISLVIIVIMVLLRIRRDSS